MPPPAPIRARLAAQHTTASGHRARGAGQSGMLPAGCSGAAECPARSARATVMRINAHGSERASGRSCLEQRHHGWMARELGVERALAVVRGTRAAPLVTSASDKGTQARAVSTTHPGREDGGESPAQHAAQHRGQTLVLLGAAACSGVLGGPGLRQNSAPPRHPLRAQRTRARSPRSPSSVPADNRPASSVASVRAAKGTEPTLHLRDGQRVEHQIKTCA